MEAALSDRQMSRSECQNLDECEGQGEHLARQVAPCE